MIEKDKGQMKYRGVLLSPYLSLVSRLVLGGVFLYAGASKIFDPGGLRPSYALTGSVCPSGSLPSRPTRCPRSRYCSGSTCSSVSLPWLRPGRRTG